MHLGSEAATILIPDAATLDEACARVTHLGIGAHPDDIELIAVQGVIAGRVNDARAFGAVVCADGAGGPRAGAYASLSDDQMRALRSREQAEAARLGRYGLMVQLGLPSSRIRGSKGRPGDETLVRDLTRVVEATRPATVYTHSLADRHETHVAVALATIAALRALPAPIRPVQVYGCEVWGSLDWLEGDHRNRVAVGGHDDLCRSLIAAHASQLSSGKPYDVAALGRRAANATFDDAYSVDASDRVILAMDLTDLVQDEDADPVAFVEERLDRFRSSVLDRLRRLAR